MTLFSLITCKCPKCGKSDMFKTSAFNYTEFIKMNDSCPTCNANFHPEPGFYLGAMYFSYVINSIIFLVSALIMMVGFEFSLTKTFIFLGIIALLILPYTLRLSRTMWLAIN